MIEAKQGEWWKHHPERAYANISAGVKLDGTEEQTIVNDIVHAAKEWGEPGVAFFKSHEHGTNPCAEIGLIGTLVKDVNGDIVNEITIDMLEAKDRYEKNGFYTFESGWQGCYLTEINMATNKTMGQFFEACKAAAFIGTLQASYTRTRS